MRILFVADGRSPIALNWIRYFTGLSDEVHLATTFPCKPNLPLASMQLVPVALSEYAGNAGDHSPGKEGNRPISLIRKLVPIGLRTTIRQWLGPLTVRAAARELSSYIDKVRPDLIHAMRIPYEGMLAVMAIRAKAGEWQAPLVVSVWGNDFTLHARANASMGRLTRMTMRATDALHTDCQRDQRLASEWGFQLGHPAIVLPGGGGIQTDIFHPAAGMSNGRAELSSPLTVINPRGMRAYVRNDTFFKAIPRVLEVKPAVLFTCPAMAEETQAQQWVQSLGIQEAVRLLPRQTHNQMADLFRSAQVAVSPSFHDGTPNTLLEAMACGCFPVAGDLESLREWIEPGVNGFLVEPGDPAALAEAILKALGNPELRRSAAEENIRLIAEKAEYGMVMAKAEAFYHEVIKKGPSPDQ